VQQTLALWSASGGAALFVEAIAIYELCGNRDGDGNAQAAFCERRDTVYASIQRDEAGAVLIRISDFLAEYPRDGVAQYHAERLCGAIQRQT
jgi:adenylate cyclase